MLCCVVLFSSLQLKSESVLWNELNNCFFAENLLILSTQKIVDIDLSNSEPRFANFSEMQCICPFAVFFHCTLRVLWETNYVIVFLFLQSLFNQINSKAAEVHENSDKSQSFRVSVR